MQVLKNSKVKFVSAVSVSLLTSFWVCLCSSDSSRFYCLTLRWKKKKSLLLTLSLPNGFCWSSWILQAEGGWALFFFLSCSCARMGAQSVLQYSQVPSFQPTPSEHSALGFTLSTAHMRQACASIPPCCATLWLIYEVHWVRANLIPSAPSLLVWACNWAKPI